MSVQEIEQAISKLKPTEIAALADWFAEYQADVWDKQMVVDSNAGKFDALIAEAQLDYKSCQVKKL